MCSRNCCTAVGFAVAVACTKKLNSRDCRSTYVLQRVWKLSLFAKLVLPSLFSHLN